MKHRPLISAAFVDSRNGWWLRESPKAPKQLGEKRLYVLKDGKREERALPHTATSCVAITSPESAVVTLNWPGDFTVNADGASTEGQLWRRVDGVEDERYGDTTKLVNVCGVAHALATDGGVFRLDSLSRWACIDRGLTRDDRVRAMAGDALDDMYGVGGEHAFHFDGRRWKKLGGIAKDARLNAVTMMNGEPVVGGMRRLVLRRHGSKWERLEGVDDDVWGLTYFKRTLYASGFDGLWALEGKSFKRVKLRGSTLSLGSNEHVLWSLGEEDLRLFDGRSWTRVAT